MNAVSIEKEYFGTTADGLAVDRFTLRNQLGMVLRLINFGAIVTELHVPDRHGQAADVVLGFDYLNGYEAPGPYFGCVVGRVAFRTAFGRFDLDGQTHQLTLNCGEHHLHGGCKGFSHQLWRAEAQSGDQRAAVRMTLASPHGDQGYPGNLNAVVTYALTDENELVLDYQATSDEPTPVNLTHHGYFNLAGKGQGTVLDHRVQIAAPCYAPSGPQNLPTGELLPVARTPYDFLRPRLIGDRLGELPGGYDVVYLREAPGDDVQRVATVEHPASGRRMDVLSDQPAVIFYTGNALPEKMCGKGDVPYGPHSGLCLETGRPPDAIHHPAFPTVVLQPGQTYRHTCIYRFSTMSND